MSDPLPLGYGTLMPDDVQYVVTIRMASGDEFCAYFDTENGAWRYSNKVAEELGEPFVYFKSSYRSIIVRSENVESIRIEKV